MKRIWLVLIPIVIVGIGAAGFVGLVMSRDAPETQLPAKLSPFVEVMEVQPRRVQLVVESQGTVGPRTESTLVPQVAGRVIEVSPAFVAGGFFEKGQTLVRIDPTDYRQAVVQARAQLARAELALAVQRAEAEIAIKEWTELEGGEAPPLTRREPQLADAQASVEAAQATFELAELNLERTRVRAPYAGRMRQKLIGVGQFVSPGTPLGRVYSVDLAEVRLPIPDRELAFVDLPLSYRGERSASSGPAVELEAEFAGERHIWRGRIVRTEGEIDPRSRMIHAVAQVRDPYGRGDDPDRPPLAVGLFVQARILGREVNGVFVVPRGALRGETRLLVVDDENRLRFREVDVLRTTAGEVYVRSGLTAGERVCLSPLAVVTDGMQVRVQPAATAGTGSAP